MSEKPGSFEFTLSGTGDTRTLEVTCPPFGQGLFETLTVEDLERRAQHLAALAARWRDEKKEA